ncbi:hypothetical protein QZH41_006306 [Actinostola sp. cb2023]|nr:hypothetical protein QZH41_006306 [Actinostola sp. cb2023]
MKRILIEGKAGVGKSTLASEMVYDWATGESNSAFKLVFLIELRHVNKGIKDAMFDLLFPKDFSVSCEQLYSYVTLHPEDILFILDGYDEVNPSTIPDLHDLITGKMLKTSTVVVTTRPGKGSKIHWYMDTRVEVTGFTAENMHQYIRKYFQDDPKEAEALISDLNMNPISENIARIPFTTLLICAMWEEMPHSQVLSTMTGLFIELTLCLVKRYYVKDKSGAEFDAENISVLDDIPPKLHKSLLSLGEVALTGLLEDQLIFDRKFLETRCCNDEIFELGFLTHERSASRLKPIQMCRFLHRSYQEFLAAFWLSDQIKRALLDPSVYEETLVHIMKCLHGELLTVLFSFTPGLLGEHFEKFFEILIQEGNQVSNDDLQQLFFMVCLQALYESQQGNLADMLSKNVVKGTVKLKTSDPTPYGIRSLAYFMQNSSDVHTLIFEDSFLAKRNLATLARCLFEIKNLKELHLVNSCAVADAMNVFTDNLGSLSIEKLVISKSKILVKNLAAVIQSCPRLRDIDLNYNEIAEENVCDLLGALKALPKLERLSISREKITHPNMDHLCSLMTNNSHLTHLTLNKIVVSDIKDIISVLDALCNCAETITYLSLSDPVIRGRSPLKAKSKKVVVDVERSPMYQALQRVLPKLKHLTHLDLSRNELSGWSNIQECISNLKMLQFLNVSGNGIGDEGLVKLTNIVSNFPAIEELHLAWNQITCQGVIALATELASLSKLRVLSLKSNKISDDGAKAIFKALAKIPSIREILIDNNFITDKGFLSVIVHAAHMKNLECLNLKKNLMGEIGILTLADAMESLPQLKQLLIGCPVVLNDGASG